MRPQKTIALLAALAALLALPAAAQAQGFGIEPGSFRVTSLADQSGVSDEAASTHPYSWTLSFGLNADSEGHSIGGELRDVLIDLPPGMVGDPFALPRCTRQQFEGGYKSNCLPQTQVGVLHAKVQEAQTGAIIEIGGPIYNIVPPPGVAAQLGFSGISLVALQNASLRTETPLAAERYGLRVATSGIPVETTQIEATIWGVPGDSSHDPEREEESPGPKPELAFLTLPAQCSTPPLYRVSVDSKLDPGHFVSAETHVLDPGGQPAPLSGCGAVPFSPKVSAQTTSRAASAASGLDFQLSLPNEGLTSPHGVAETEPQKIEVALPEGVTANPSAAEGLATCTEAQYEAEQIDSGPGEGCPEASKLGSIVAHSPLLDEPIEGSLYLATPYANPEGTLIGLYLVFRAAERGVLVKQSGRVIPDPSTGRLITTLEGLPPLPYSDATLHFREGARGVLVTPEGCGSYATTAKLYPFSDPNTPTERTAYFQIERGVDGGACPSGAQPFDAGFEAGSANPIAGRYSPFSMRLTRKDGDQDLTRFSTKLPPGVIGRLAGTSQCPDAAIAAARGRTGPHGGTEELDSPSCPASSEIGRTVAGAGVGGVLTYVPGHLYLAGPYNGAPLSVVAITPGVAGPFDVGTIVVRQALRIDPLTAEVEADGSSSDPIPHILKGIPLKVRDIRVYVDKPDFTLNPTSCEPSAARATIWGGGANVFSSLDDTAHALQARFQAASCASLAFKPRLGLKLKGGTRRGKFPALRAVYSPKQGDANLKRLALTFPKSEFIEQGHFRTICTRVQFAAGAGHGSQCPKGAVYGHVKVWTPLLSEPLTGPVYLRSSSHNLPDAVLALHGPPSAAIDLEVAVRIDSAHGGLRATVEGAPDAPVSRVIVNMQGGKKGLFVNSTNLCAAKHRARVNAGGQNGRRDVTKPVMRAQCKKAHRKRHRGHKKKGGAKHRGNKH